MKIHNRIQKSKIYSSKSQLLGAVAPFRFRSILALACIDPISVKLNIDSLGKLLPFSELLQKIWIKITGYYRVEIDPGQVPNEVVIE